LQKIMKSAACFAALIGAAAAGSVMAAPFQNEPDGFREIKLGTAISAAPDLVEAQNASWLWAANMERRYGASAPGALKSYFRKDDKREFAGLPVRLVAYNFYRDRFVSTTLYYDDTTKTGPAQAYDRMHNIGEAPPAGHDAHKKMDSALRKYFGDPTEGATGLMRFAMGIGGRTAYRGDVTDVVAECTGGPKMDCSVTFSSKEIEGEAAKEFAGIAKDRGAARQAEKAEIEKREAAKKAKPDF